MASQEKQEEAPQQSQQEAGGPLTVGWIKAIKRQYQWAKQDIETYPYVWASYGVVYGGFGLWLTYRWRALRKLEDRVRILQAKMRERAKEAEAAKSAAKAPSGGNTTAKPADNAPSANSTSTKSSEASKSP
uniref:Uncharacterized protein n=1 Tax=Kalanchoe fedtschenkoi TaxID=63787 RepID=A0A7N0U7H1_KALFE